MYSYLVHMLVYVYFAYFDIYSCHLICLLFPPPLFRSLQRVSLVFEARAEPILQQQRTTISTTLNLPAKKKPIRLHKFYAELY